MLTFRIYTFNARTPDGLEENSGGKRRRVFPNMRALHTYIIIIFYINRSAVLPAGCCYPIQNTTRLAKCRDNNLYLCYYSPSMGREEFEIARNATFSLSVWMCTRICVFALYCVSYIYISHGAYIHIYVICIHYSVVKLLALNV